MVWFLNGGYTPIRSVPRDRREPVMEEPGWPMTSRSRWGARGTGPAHLVTFGHQHGLVADVDAALVDRHVAIGDDPYDAGQRFGFGCINTPCPGVGMLTPDGFGMGKSPG